MLNLLRSSIVVASNDVCFGTGTLRKLSVFRACALPPNLAPALSPLDAVLKLEMVPLESLPSQSGVSQVRIGFRVVQICSKLPSRCVVV